MHCLPLVVMKTLKPEKMLEGEGAVRLLGSLRTGDSHRQMALQNPARDKEMGKKNSELCPSPRRWEKGFWGERRIGKGYL